MYIHMYVQTTNMQNLQVYRLKVHVQVQLLLNGYNANSGTITITIAERFRGYFY